MRSVLPRHVPSRLQLGMAALIVAACGREAAAPRGRPSLEIVSGDGQSGPVGTELPNALVVRVLDEPGQGRAGQVVNFRVTGGGGSVFAGASVTNNSGIAQERWTLGTNTADAQRLEARAVDNVTGEALTFAVFTATARAGPPAQLEPNEGGDGQTAAAGTAVPIAPSVSVRDRYGNAVPGTPVSFAVASGGGSITGASDTTDAAGIAAVGSWTLGDTAGTNTLSATVSGLPVVTFTATATGSVSVASVTVTPAAASVAQGATLQLEATPKDSAGKVLTGRAVSWASSDTTAATVNGSGLVTGVRPGEATVTATSGGKSGVAAITVTPSSPSGAVSCLTQAGPTVPLSAVQTSTFQQTSLAPGTKIDASTAQFLTPANVSIEVGGGSGLCFH